MDALFSNREFVFFLNLLLVLGAGSGLLHAWLRVVSYVSAQLAVSRLFSFVLFGVTLFFFRSQIESFCGALSGFVAYPYQVTNGNNVLLHAVNALNSGNLTFKLGNLVVLCLSALTVWAVGVWALAKTFAYTREKLKQNPNIDFFDQYITKAFLVSSLFLAALFLVVSTIIAVPEFQSIETGIDVDKLEQEFSAELAKRMPPASQKNDAGKLEEADLRINLDSLRKEIARNVPLDTMKRNTVSTEISETLKNPQQDLLMLVFEYNLLVDRFLAFRDSRPITLQNKYITEVSKGMSERSRMFYRSQLLNEGMSIIQQAKTHLRSTKSSIEAYNRDQRYSNYAEIDRFRKEARKNLSVIKNLFNSDTLSADAITPSLSIFGFMSRWLLQTRSLSLALIVGMFGFGLLGAISSSYIRVNIQHTNAPDKPEQKATTEDVLDNLDLRSLLITGITAAIIIFLSVKGALVVLTASEDGANINPYVLFFICFAAALYNEEVWQWVLQKFRGYMRQEPKTGAANKPADAETKKVPLQTSDSAKVIISPGDAQKTLEKLAQKRVKTTNNQDKGGSQEDLTPKDKPQGT